MQSKKLNRLLFRSAFACALAAPIVPALAKEKKATKKVDEHLVHDLDANGQWTPPLKPASDAGERAIAKFKVASGLKIALWAAEPMMGDPCAICTDENGRIYVAETYRYHGGVIDIRAAMNWLDEDLASKTVADRVAMVERHAKDKNDHNAQEAAHWRDSERIVVLEDTDGQGKANQSTVFTSGYNRTEDGLGAGVLAYHGSVYYTCIPSLYLLKDTTGDGKANVKQALQTGYGIRYGFLGHDLHGLVIGPDGRLYFSVGDRAANVQQTPDGRHVENLESGAVFRCDLDGTHLEIYATGLRNPQELRFDAYGNLFTGDNNPDKGDPARWVHVIENGDSGWRVGYQHANHTANGGPWMSEQIWSGEANNNADYIVPCITPLGAGPSGLAYYPGTGLPDHYQDHFFLCDFRGGSTNSLIHCIKMKEKGAGFEVTENEPFIEHLLATDCEFAVDGGLYVSDWTEGWTRPMAGRIYKITDPAKISDPLVLQTKKLIAEGMAHRPVDELTKLLAFADIRVRQEAQFALASQGAAAIPVLTPIAQKSDSLIPRLHAIWGLGQIARQSPDAVAGLVPLLSDKDLEVRCQSAQVLGDAKSAAAYEPLLKMLQQPEPRARFFAAMALGKLGNKEAVSAIFNTLKENADKDATLRYGCVTALVKLNDKAALLAASKDPSPSIRLAAELAFRRIGDPAIAMFLHDPDPQVVLEAARAINDLPIVEALPELAAMIDKPLPSGAEHPVKPAAGQGPKPIGGPGEWIQWREVNANFRLGTPQAAQALASFAAKGNAPAAVRVEAIKDLAEWQNPAGRDHITSLWRPLPPRDPRVARQAVAAALLHLPANTPNDVKVAATNVMKQFGLGDPASLAATVEDKKAAPDVRVAALESLAALHDHRLHDAVKAALADQNQQVRRAGISAQAAQPGGVASLQTLLENGTIRDQQAVLDGLGAARGKEADQTLSAWMGKLLAGKVQPALQLDLLEAAAKSKDPAIEAKLKQYNASRDPKDKLSPYRECLAGGDAALGHQIFRERADVSCIRCHSAQGEGGVVGPKLDGIGAKQTREYLLQSIVDPNARIAPGFESLLVQTKEGKFRVGILKKEDAKELVLLNPDLEPDKQLITLPKSDIKSRERGPSAMPEGLVKTLSRDDLRNLVEFLADLK